MPEQSLADVLGPVLGAKEESSDFLGRREPREMAGVNLVTSRLGSSLEEILEGTEGKDVSFVETNEEKAFAE